MEISDKEESIGYLLQRTTRTTCEFLNQKLIPFDLRVEHWGALMHLAHYGQLSHKALADFMGKDKTNITRLADFLEKKGWLIRLQDQADRRNKHLKLTEKGEEFVQKMAPMMQNHFLPEATQGLSPGELAQLKKLLKKLYFSIKNNTQ